MPVNPPTLRKPLFPGLTPGRADLWGWNYGNGANGHGSSIFWGNDGGATAAIRRGINSLLNNKNFVNGAGSVNPVTGRATILRGEKADTVGLGYIKRHWNNGSYYYTRMYRNYVRQMVNRVVMQDVRTSQAAKVRLMVMANIQKMLSPKVLIYSNPTAEVGALMTCTNDLELNAPWLKEAFKYYKLKEIPDSHVHNETIVKFFNNTSYRPVNDDEGWCAAFLNTCLAEAGIMGTNSAFARSFLDWGYEVSKPMIGAIVIFKRPGPNGNEGHVGIIVGVKADGSLLVLGGNQGNSVKISTYSTDNVLGYRLPNGY